jgi:hypothetical protein
VNEIKTVPYVPLSHPFVERLIGTIRREYLDLILFWTLLIWRRSYSIFKITSMATGPTRGWKDACQNRRATDLDYQ